LICQNKSLDRESAEPEELAMAILMPQADSSVLKRRAEIVASLRAIVPGEGVIDTPAEMRAYESDGSPPIASRRWSWSCRTPPSRSRKS
jgi:hypothetical protein